MKKRDLILIAGALVRAGALYLVSRLSLGTQAAVVVVTVDGVEKLRRPLAMEGSYAIEQEDGSRNVICVGDGAVWMEEANCRDGLCIRQGRMKNAAKTIVCLPHKLVVRLEGDAPQGGDDELDVIVR